MSNNNPFALLDRDDDDDDLHAGVNDTVLLKDIGWASRDLEVDIDAKYWTRMVDDLNMTVVSVSDRFPPQAWTDKYRMGTHHSQGMMRERRKRINKVAFQHLFVPLNRIKMYNLWMRKNMSLSKLAVKNNITTGALARIICRKLLGSHYCETLLDASERYFRPDIACRDPLDTMIISALPRETQAALQKLIQQSRDDRLWSVGTSWHCDQANTTEQTIVSSVREWVPRNAFETESNQKSRGEASDTPDILLKDPIHVRDFGTSEIHWIEIKTGWVIPALTSASVINNLVDQTSRYVKRFGAGMIMWTQGWVPTVEILTGPQVFHCCPVGRLLSRDIKSSQ
jgi:hypothetical protein